MRSPGGASAEILRLTRLGRIQLLANVALALEYEAICGRAEHRRAAALSDTNADVFVAAVVALTEPVESHFLWRPQLRDPGDEMVLEAAVNGRADALVTFNKRDFGEVPIRFGIEVLLPREALERIRE
jgi:predicted nucleic acid-binding protein